MTEWWEVRLELLPDVFEPMTYRDKQTGKITRSDSFPDLLLAEVFVTRLRSATPQQRYRVVHCRIVSEG